MASNGNSVPMSAHNSSKPKTLMESLLVAKMEQVTMGHPGRPLVRTDSADSTSSMGSVTSSTSDVCRCDDCLLGIADLYAQEPSGDRQKKKVNVTVIDGTTSCKCERGWIGETRELATSALNLFKFGIFEKFIES